MARDHRTALKPFAAGVVLAAIALTTVLAAWLARAPAPPAPPLRPQDASAVADTRSAEAALAAVRRAWLSELERVRELTRSLSTDEATADFVARPNFPFVDENFRPDDLVARDVDTVLVVDAARRPVFWRRPNDRGNEGFPDAERFLAAMPDFTAVRAVRGEPVLEGAVRFPRGTQLVTVMPLFGRGRDEPRGYLVFGRTLDGPPARRVAESAAVPVDVLAPDDPHLGARVRQRLELARGLAPVIVSDPDTVRGYAPVHDVLGRVERVYAVALPRAVSLVRDPAPDARRTNPWLWLAGTVLALLLAAAALLRSQQTRTTAGSPPTATARTRDAAAASAAPAPAAPSNATPANPARAAAIVPPDAGAHAAAARDDAFLEQVLVHGDTGEEHAVEDVVVPDDPSPLDLDVHVEAATAPESSARPASSPPPIAAPTAPRPMIVPTPAAVPDRASATPALRHAELVRGLVEAGRVRVHYQPQVSAATGGIVGVEALLRWQDEGSVLRSAAELFDDHGPEPFAAATEFVLRRACADRRAWLAQIGRTLPVSVNVGLAELRDPAFLERVARILEESDVAPAYLELEVPEAALADAASAEAETLDRAYRMGLSIAIGGFVAADAPLRALTNLPVAKLKLARSLVAELPNDDRSRAVVEAILAVGRTLGVVVCAEGVETAAQAEYLEQRHCPLLQGWHCGRAMEADRFLELLKESGIDTMRLPLMDMEELESHARAAGLA